MPKRQTEKRKSVRKITRNENYDSDSVRKQPWNSENSNTESSKEPSLEKQSSKILQVLAKRLKIERKKPELSQTKFSTE